MSSGPAARNGYPEPEAHQHACPQCGAPVDCAFKTLAEAKAQARHDFMVAMHVERRLLGLKSGRPRKLDLTPEQCEALVKELGTINRARKHVGVGFNTFVRYLTGDPKKR